MNRDVVQETKNKEFVLEAIDTLFNKRDYATAESYWSPEYIQHSALIPPGRAGLFDLVKDLPPSVRYESALAVAEGDYVIIHGRLTGMVPAAWVTADIVRLEGGRIAEHWDVIEEEVTRGQSKSGRPMFKDRFPGGP